MKSFRTLNLVALSALLAAGCGRRALPKEHLPEAGKSYPAAYGDMLVEGSLGDPTILNPVLASDSASFEVTGLVFNSLLRYGKDLNLTGELADRWFASSDGKTLTFVLKKNITWQDGVPLTARDVQFTLEVYLNPKVKTAYRSNYEMISGSDVVNDLTLRVHYREPFAPALETLGGMAVLPEHLLAGKDINTADAFNFKPVGSGPYRFQAWKRAESVQLEFNPAYFEGRANLNRVIYRVIPDMSVQFMELRNGGLDMMGLTPDQYHGEASQPAFTRRFNRYRYPSNQYTYLGFNLKHPLFQDERFRRGIALAIDKQALVDSVLEGLGQVATGPYTPTSWAYNSEVKPAPYNLNLARKLFVEMGCQYGKDGLLLWRNQPVQFTLLTNQGNKNREQTATIIQAQLKEAGITVNTRVIAWSTFLAEFVNKRKFDAVLLGWSLSQDPDLYDIWHSSKTGEQEFNFVSYANPEVDRLLVRGRRTFDREERKEIYHRLHSVIAQDLPYVFLYVPDNLPAVHRRVLGIEPGKAGISYNFIRWYVPQGFQKYAQ